MRRLAILGASGQYQPWCSIDRWRQCFSVSDLSWVGIGASVLELVRIGSQVIVGAGAAVTTYVAGTLTVVGVPARAQANNRYL